MIQICLRCVPRRLQDYLSDRKHSHNWSRNIVSGVLSSVFAVPIALATILSLGEALKMPSFPKHFDTAVFPAFTAACFTGGYLEAKKASLPVFAFFTFLDSITAGLFSLSAERSSQEQSPIRLFSIAGAVLGSFAAIPTAQALLKQKQKPQVDEHQYEAGESSSLTSSEDETSFLKKWKWALVPSTTSLLSALALNIPKTATSFDNAAIASAVTLAVSGIFDFFTRIGNAHESLIKQVCIFSAVNAASVFLGVLGGGSLAHSFTKD